MSIDEEDQDSQQQSGSHDVQEATDEESLDEEEALELRSNDEFDSESSNKSPASAKHIRALTSTVKSILQSDEIHDTTSASVVDTLISQHTKDMETNDATIVSSIVKAISPFIPKRNNSCFITELAFVVLANKILTAIGFDDRTQPVCPDVKPSAIHALSLNATTLYETLSPHHRGHPLGPYQVVRSHGANQTSAITSVETARKEKDTMIWSFFNQQKVQDILSSFHIYDIRTIVYNIDQTVRFVGPVLESHPPIFSAYEKRKKKSSKETDNTYCADDIKIVESEASKRQELLKRGYADMRFLVSIRHRSDMIYKATTGRKKMAMGVVHKWLKRRCQQQQHHNLLLRRCWKDVRNQIWRMRHVRY